MNKTFINNLKQARISSKLTQKQVALILNVVDSCYANWEQGRTEPNTEALEKLCQIFNVSADYLLGLTDDPTPNWIYDNAKDPTAI